MTITVGGNKATLLYTVGSETMITTRPSAEVFEPLATAGVLTVVWHFDNDTKAWSFYDPRPEVAAAVDLTEVTSGRQRLDSGHGRHRLPRRDADHRLEQYHPRLKPGTATRQGGAAQAAAPPHPSLKEHGGTNDQI